MGGRRQRRAPELAQVMANARRARAARETCEMIKWLAETAPDRIDTETLTRLQRMDPDGFSHLIETMVGLAHDRRPDELAADSCRAFDLLVQTATAYLCAGCPLPTPLAKWIIDVLAKTKERPPRPAGRPKKIRRDLGLKLCVHFLTGYYNFQLGRNEASDPDLSNVAFDLAADVYNMNWKDVERVWYGKKSLKNRGDY